jgi:very-short-patch-repair endonuclease
MAPSQSYLVLILLNRLERAGVPLPILELRFHPARKWRFDCAWVPQRVAVEVDGGTYTAGRHTRGAGFAADCEKLNTATLLGWRVLRFTRAMIESGEAVTMIARALDETA